MEEKKVFRYIKKLIPYVVVLSFLASLLIYVSLRNKRTYTASAVIHYTFESAEKGKTPNNTDLDVNEIKSSNIMSKVIERMGLTGSYSVDKLTSRITITSRPDADKEAQKEAKLKEGEEYVYVPSTYIVAFSASNAEGAGFARQMLDEILDTYFSVFGENYINVDHISNKIEKLYDHDYDYLEMVEYIDKSVEETINALYLRDAAYPYYRSTETGTSFDDLIDAFDFVRTVTLRDLYSQIYQYQITKSRSLLNATYNTRIDNNTITAANEKGMFEDIVEVVNAYVRKMRESGNTAITHEYILNEVHNKDITDGEGNVITKSDQTVTYDELMYAWRDHSLNDELAVIDTAYCHYVLDAFNTCTGNCGGACKGAAKTCSQLSNSDYVTIESAVEAKIRTVVDELSALYQKTVQTNSEYNEYLGCKNIETLSTPSTVVNMNVTMYSVIAFIFLVVVCCGGLILVGRLDDIITANFYTDGATKFYNRAYFDRYLKKKGRNVLDDGTVMVSVRVTNQKEINTAHGRDVGDAVILLIAEQLRQAFARMTATFVYNGNAHFVVVLEKTDAITAQDALQMFRLDLDSRESCENVRIAYETGVAETFRDRVTSARQLLAEAIKNSKDYAAEPKN